MWKVFWSDGTQNLKMNSVKINSNLKNKTQFVAAKNLKYSLMVEVGKEPRAERMRIN